ncbi:DUF1003 domain-containing protein [Elstera sp.]|jgi:uncharacterized membrane protein|uniref:DUF1003 domain-containing protein n=1 Tax=Elstera sp. TaxID=1916664 RepID=UPI0037C031F3
MSDQFSADDQRRLTELRRQRPSTETKAPPQKLGDRVSDHVAATVGSWRFIIIQSVILSIWIALNATAFIFHWDPYPFILLNLILSFQAAYTAPIIMMSQNRQAEVDRRNAAYDYAVNVKAELEIELLHAKIDALREQEIQRLTKIIEKLSDQLAEKSD